MRTKPVQIACPEYGVLVRGEYECDALGRYRLDAEGNFLLGRVRCGQRGGKCAQTLCVLHRFNRRGPETWFPDRVLALAEPATPRRPRPAPPTPGENPHGETDILA